MTSDNIDPYHLFNEWCKANGFADVIESEDTDSVRLDAAIDAYAAAGGYSDD